MLTVKWELASGESGQIALDNEDKWSFGRVGAEEPPTVVTEDPRISRNALTVRDSGPGPVVFRGQRGDAVSIRVVNVDGKLQEAVDEIVEILKKEGYQYTSTKITTKGKKEFRYGRFEARAQLPTGHGIWPAFWMLGANIDKVGWPKSGEIDIHGCI